MEICTSECMKLVSFRIHFKQSQILPLASDDI